LIINDSEMLFSCILFENMFNKLGFVRCS